MSLTKRRDSFRPKRRSASSQKKVRLAIECTRLERRQIKMLAASVDETLNDFVLESVRMRIKECSHSHIPNSETAKALRDAEKGENLIEYTSMEDLLKSLEE